MAMLILKDTVGMAAKNPDLFKYINTGYLDYVITYLFDSRFRESIVLKSWLKDQVQNPSNAMVTAAAEAVKTLGNKNSDNIVIACLKYVIRNITYVSDQKTWGTSEKWQTAEETLNLKTGDCEDGAILLYVLCRLNGVSQDQLLLDAGNVEGGGHCWLSYRPLQYPINFVFLDWCYWPNELYMDSRPKFYIQDQKIYGEDDRYYSIWFAFNEDKSYSGLRNRYKPAVAK